MKQIQKIIVFLFFVCILVLTGGVSSEAMVEKNSTDTYTYRNMVNDLREMSTEYSDFCALSSIAETMDGRDVYCLRIGPENAPEKILITGAIHAREYITTKLCMKQAEDFLQGVRSGAQYDGISYASMLSDTAVYLVPMVDPDGVTISQFGLAGLRKQSTVDRVLQIAAMDGAQSLSSYLRTWKSNANGVDLNRNFDALWEQYNDNVGHPSSDHYKSTAIATEPEVIGLIELTKKENFNRTVSYHTQGGVIYWYFGQTGDLYDQTKALADQIHAVTGYPLDANYQALDPAGYKDWAISKMGIPSLTIEVGQLENPVPENQFGSIYEQNKNVWPALITGIR